MKLNAEEQNRRVLKENLSGRSSQISIVVTRDKLVSDIRHSGVDLSEILSSRKGGSIESLLVELYGNDMVINIGFARAWRNLAEKGDQEWEVSTLTQTYRFSLTQLPQGSPQQNERRQSAYLLVIQDVTTGSALKSAKQNIVEVIEHTAQYERHRLATELHDGIAQEISAVKYNLEAAIVVLNSKYEIDVTSLDNTVEQLQKLSAGLRRVFMRLDPEPLNRGLCSAVDALCKTLGVVEQGPLVSFIQKGVFTHLNRNIEFAAYRLIQEALHNALSHANAQHIVVDLQATENSLSLSVEDDGNGFVIDGDASLDDSGYGFGINNMRNRTTESHGIFHIRSDPSAGTKVEVKWRLSAN